jgi:hypothetical protein
MSLLSKLRNLVQTWRRRPSPLRTRPRAAVSLEQLDHRQLLAVNFTGNAIADIPGTIGNPPLGTAFVVDNNRIPIAPALQPLIRVSGMDIDVVRMKYTPEDDTLSVAIQQPPNEKTLPSFPVIAGDTDNNLNGGTIDPAVLAIDPSFEDVATLGGTETMTVTFDFTGDRVPDVVAGISSDPGVQKLFLVADAIPNPIDPVGLDPSYGTPLQRFTGFAFLDDTDPSRGAFEFQIRDFSQLYQLKSGQPFNRDTVFNVGLFSRAANDAAGEDFKPADTPVRLGLDPIPDCPPLSPPVQINPHASRHVNTAHPNYVRVTVFGTSGFRVRNIDPGSVRFAGAQPLFRFIRRVNADNFPDQTFVFDGSQLDLPPGRPFAAITGLYDDPATGQQVPFSSGHRVFVRTRESFSPQERQEQQRRLAVDPDPLSPLPSDLVGRAAANNVQILQNASASSFGLGGGTVRIRRRDAAPTPRDLDRLVVQPTGRGGIVRREASTPRINRPSTARSDDAPRRRAFPQPSRAVAPQATPRLSKAAIHDMAMAALAAR